MIRNGCGIARRQHDTFSMYQFSRHHQPGDARHRHIDRGEGHSRTSEAADRTRRGERLLRRPCRTRQQRSRSHHAGERPVQSRVLQRVIQVLNLLSGASGFQSLEVYTWPVSESMWLRISDILCSLKLLPGTKHTWNVITLTKNSSLCRYLVYPDVTFKI